MENINLDNFKKEEEIIAALANIDNDTLKALVAYILKLYVIDKQIPYEGKINDNEPMESLQSNPVEKNFHSLYQLLTYLKKNFPFPELNYFELEDEKVYFNSNNNKTLITTSSGTKQNSVNQKKQEARQNMPDDRIKSSPERFKNLEIDK